MSPSPSLSRDLILRTAVEHVDQHGLTALSMRNLGARLGVEAMSLYHHVNGREDLLEGMVDLVTRDIVIPSHEVPAPGDGWQSFLQEVAHAVRAVARAHPQVFPLISTRPPAAPWLRPPLRNLRLVDEFLRGLVDRGLPDDRVVQVYKGFTSFLLGHLLLEVAIAGVSTGLPNEPLDEGDADVPNRDQDLDLSSYPHVLELAGPLRQSDPDAEFEVALEALLDHLDRTLSQ